MKYLLYCFLIFNVISCTPSVQEIWINEDGSGKMETTIDLGSMIGMMDNMFPNESEENGDNTEEHQFDNIDSTMNFYTDMPDSVKQKMDNPEILRNLSCHFKMNKSSDEFIIKFMAVYDNLEELEETFTAFGEALKVTKDAEMLGEEGKDVSSLMVQYQQDLKNGVIRIPRTDYLEEFQEGEFEQMVSEIDSLKNASEEERQMYEMMVEMMFGQGTTTILHAPRKILFTNDPDAIINGKTVTFFSNPMKHLMRGETPPSHDIIIKLKD